MKLGVFDPLFSQLSLDDMLDKLQAAGLEAVEIGTGGYPGNAHCDIDTLLVSEEARMDYLKKFEDHGLMISAFSCHSNPIAPNKDEAKAADELIRKTIKLASLMNVAVVNTFSGTAGDSEEAKMPNWPVTAWPDEYMQIKNWQWEHKLIPYWKEIGELATAHNVKIGLELHGGFLVHTPYTLLKLREATCEAIGANLDPSHLWWQGIDPVAAIKLLGAKNAIHHFHAKDTYIDPINVNLHGLLDMQPYGDLRNRSWYFRSVGCGHDLATWSDIVSALRLYDYDYVMSIEHEDALMSPDEGFMRAVTNLKSVIIKEEAGAMWWA